jgi:hypothetical protein
LKRQGKNHKKFHLKSR